MSSSTPLKPTPIDVTRPQLDVTACHKSDPLSPGIHSPQCLSDSASSMSSAAESLSMILNEFLPPVVVTVSPKCFTTSCAAGTVAIPRKLPFRGDLNEFEQLLSRHKERNTMRDAAHVKEWKRTFASKDDHRMFLKMLVVEGYLQGKGRNNKVPSAPLRERAKSLLITIDEAFHSETAADPYAMILETIHAERLFQSDAT